MWDLAFKRIIYHKPILDIAEELILEASTSKSPLSTGLRFHGDKIVFKHGGGKGQAVPCHADFAYYPHTNSDMCTVSVVLEDMTVSGGGLLFLPGSHNDAHYSHHHEDGTFTGAITQEGFDPNSFAWDAVECSAGSLIVHHVRTVHASGPNKSSTDRPLLLLQYAALDSWPLQQHTRGAWGIDIP